jgi:hypothetical protein
VPIGIRQPLRSFPEKSSTGASAAQTAETKAEIDKKNLGRMNRMESRFAISLAAREF